MEHRLENRWFIPRRDANFSPDPARLRNRVSLHRWGASRKERGRRVTRRVRLSRTLRLSHSFSRGINAAKKKKRKIVKVFCDAYALFTQRFHTRVERKTSDRCGPRCRWNLRSFDFFDTCSATPIARLEPFCLDNCITVGLIPCFERKNPFLFRHDSNVVIRIG